MGLFSNKKSRKKALAGASAPPQPQHLRPPPPAIGALYGQPNGGLEGYPSTRAIPPWSGPLQQPQDMVSITCGACSTLLEVPFGIDRVKCGRCFTIQDVGAISRIASPRPDASNGSPQLLSPPATPGQTPATWRPPGLAPHSPSLSIGSSSQTSPWDSLLPNSGPQEPPSPVYSSYSDGTLQPWHKPSGQEFVSPPVSGEQPPANHGSAQSSPSPKASPRSELVNMFGNRLPAKASRVLVGGKDSFKQQKSPKHRAPDTQLYASSDTRSSLQGPEEEPPPPLIFRGSGELFGDSKAAAASGRQASPKQERPKAPRLFVDMGSAASSGLPSSSPAPGALPFEPPVVPDPRASSEITRSKEAEEKAPVEADPWSQLAAAQSSGIEQYQVFSDYSDDDRDGGRLSKVDDEREKLQARDASMHEEGLVGLSSTGRPGSGLVKTEVMGNGEETSVPPSDLQTSKSSIINQALLREVRLVSDDEDEGQSSERSGPSTSNRNNVGEGASKETGSGELVASTDELRKAILGSWPWLDMDEFPPERPVSSGASPPVSAREASQADKPSTHLGTRDQIAGPSTSSTSPNRIQGGQVAGSEGSKQQEGDDTTNLMARIPSLVMALGQTGPRRERAVRDLAGLLASAAEAGAQPGGRNDVVVEVISLGGIALLVNVWAGRATNEREREAARVALVALSLSSDDSFKAVMMTLREKSSKERIDFRVPWSVVLLGEGSEPQKRRTAGFLGRLLDSNTAHAVAMCRAGAVPRLLAMLQTSTGANTRERAARLLGNLAAEADCRLGMGAEKGLLQALLGAVADATPGSEEVRFAAACALANLAVANENKSKIAAVPDAVAQLADVLGTATSMPLKHQLVRLLSSLAIEPAAGDEIAGSLEVFVEFLRGSEKILRSHAAAALACLARSSEDHRLALLEAGAVPALARLLMSGSMEEEANSARALANLANSREAREEMGALPAVAQGLLYQLQASGTVKEGAPLSILSLLASSEEGLAAIDEGGGFSTLLALAQATMLAETPSPSAERWAAVGDILVLLGERLEGPQAQAGLAALMQMLGGAVPRTPEGQQLVAFGAPILAALLTALEEGGVDEDISWLEPHLPDLLGCAQVLVGALPGASEEVRIAIAEIVAGVALLAGDEQVDEILNAGAVPGFLHMLQHGGLCAKARAAKALGALCPTAAVEVVEDGGVPLLVSLLEVGGEDNGEGREAALEALEALSEEERVQEEMAQTSSGVVEALMSVLLEDEEGSLELKVMAAGAVAGLAQREECSVALCEQGAVVGVLVGLLRKVPEGGEEQERVLLALGNMANASQAEVKDCLVANEAVAPLVAALRNASLQGQMFAALALGNLAVGSNRRKQLVAEAGAMTPLKDLLCSSPPPSEDEPSSACEEAAYALSVLARDKGLQTLLALNLPLEALKEQRKKIGTERGKAYLDSIEHFLAAEYERTQELQDEEDLT